MTRDELLNIKIPLSMAFKFAKKTILANEPTTDMKSLLPHLRQALAGALNEHRGDDIPTTAEGLGHFFIQNLSGQDLRGVIKAYNAIPKETRKGEALNWVIETLVASGRYELDAEGLPVPINAWED